MTTATNILMYPMIKEEEYFGHVTHKPIKQNNKL